jgi:ATP-binding cassette subfamily F protein uup
MWNNKVERLSGGERRRLYLLTVLLQQPNLLILDEPTNDLDIVTLDILEEYLQEFKGSLIIVSHDRHFLDRLVDHLFVFCGDGVVKDFIGNYSEYRSFIKDYEAAQKAARAQAARADQAKSSHAGPAKTSFTPGGNSDPSGRSSGKQGPEKESANPGATSVSLGATSVNPGPAKAPAKRRLTWKEQQELKALDEEIPRLESEKADLEARLSSGTLSPTDLHTASTRYGELQSLLDEKEMRWLELSEV